MGAIALNLSESIVPSTSDVRPVPSDAWHGPCTWEQK